jgi:hypothetical protein
MTQRVDQVPLGVRGLLRRISVWMRGDAGEVRTHLVD